MRTKNIFFSLILAAALFLTAPPANAVTAEISVDTQSAGLMFGNYSFTLNQGDSGTIRYIQSDLPSLHGKEIEFAGTSNLRLQPNTTITFTYTSDGYAPNFGKMNNQLYGEYDYEGMGYRISAGQRHYDTPDDQQYWDNAWWRTIDRYTNTVGENNPGYPDPALVFTSSQLNTEGSPSMVITVTNKSSSQFSFHHTLGLLYEGGPASVLLNYEVTKTPLPAALPMFALGLAGMVGLRRRKKQTT